MLDITPYEVTVKETGGSINLNNLVKHSDFSGEHLGYILERLCNSYSTIEIANGVSKYLVNTHHFIQQFVANFFLEVLIGIAKHSNGIDPRNEIALNFCEWLRGLSRNKEPDFSLLSGAINAHSDLNPVTYVITVSNRGTDVELFNKKQDALKDIKTIVWDLLGQCVLWRSACRSWKSGCDHPGGYYGF